MKRTISTDKYFMEKHKNKSTKLLSRLISLNNSKGFSLMGVMIAATAMSIIAMGMADMMAQMKKQQVAMEDKMGVMSLQAYAQSMLSDTNICSCNFTPTIPASPGTLGFNSNVTDGTQSISVKNLKSGCSKSSPNLIKVNDEITPRLKVTAIKMVNLEPTAPGSLNWVGDLQIHTNNPSIKPASIKQSITIDNSTPNKSIVSTCGSDGGGTSSGAPTKPIAVNPVSIHLDYIAANFQIVNVKLTGALAKARFIEVLATSQQGNCGSGSPGRSSVIHYKNSTELYTQEFAYAGGSGNTSDKFTGIVPIINGTTHLSFQLTGQKKSCNDSTNSSHGGQLFASFWE